MVIRGSHTNLSCPVCDPILKELEGATKDRSTYWRRFCKVDIISSYHYIKVGDTYKRHIQCHTNTTWSYIRAPSDYGWNTNRNSNDSTPLAQAADLEPIPWSKKQKKNSKTRKHRSRVMIFAKPARATVVVVICEPRGLSNSITMGIKTSKA